MSLARDMTTPAPLVVSRVFAAPRALVFRMWSSGAHMQRWFSPAAFTVPEAEIDFRAGGVFSICMRSAAGEEYWSRGQFTEVSPDDRLRFSAGVGIGGAVRFTVLTTVDFEHAPGGTRMTVHQAYDILDPNFASSVDGAQQGWSETLDKLEHALALAQVPDGYKTSHGYFTLERVYDVPPAQVFHALSDKKAKARWFGSDEAETLEREMEFRVGGRERLRSRLPTGMVALFDAVYYDIVPDARLVYVYEMWLDDRKISVSLATMTLAAAGPGTRLSVTEQGVFLDSYEDGGSREHGIGVMLDRLGRVLLGE